MTRRETTTHIHSTWNSVVGTSVPTLIIAVLVGVLTCARRASADGVTIITHGWNSGTTGWVAEMRDEVDARAGAEQRFGTIRVTGYTIPDPISGIGIMYLTTQCSPWDISLDGSSAGEVVISLDWSNIDTQFEGVSTVSVAKEIVDKLTTSQNGQPALVELPIHLVGHSRGGSLVCELARLLGNRGIWVDHVTTLDPHPLRYGLRRDLVVTTPFVNDAAAAIYENVLFADNYYQHIGLDIYGQSVFGAYNRKLVSLSGEGYRLEHADVHLWYHGTVDTGSDAHDGSHAITDTMRSSWWAPGEESGEKTGFYFSRIAGGPRPLSGVHTFHDGNGGRTLLQWSSAVWPNIIKIELQHDGATLGAGTHGVTTGDTISVLYTGQDRDSQSTISLRTDTDRNPYNGDTGSFFSETRPASPSGWFHPTYSWDTSGVSGGTACYVYAKITDGTRTRYMYAAPLLSFTSGGVSEPTLGNPSVSPSAGDVGGTFTYRIDYHDPAGAAPIDKKVYVDGVGYNMTLDTGTAANGTYKYAKTGLSAGVHNYRFAFWSGGGQLLVDPASGSRSGPTVSEPADPNGRVKISVFWGSDTPGDNDDGGYVHPDVSWDQTFAPGQAQWFTAYPAFGWELDHWKIRYIWSLSPGSAYYYAPDGASGNSAMMITRDVERGPNNWAENAIYCTFRRIHSDKRILTVSAVGPGSVDPGPGEYERGLTDEITMTATPSADAAFVKWLLDGTEVSTVTPYTFNMGSQDHSIEAVFQYSQTATYTVDLPCIADASIRIEDFGEDGDHYGYGSESRVGFKFYPDRRNYTWDTALKFDVSLIPADGIIQDVYLRIYCLDVPNRDGIGYEVQKNTSAWDEDTMQSTQPTCLNPVNYNGDGLFNDGEDRMHNLHVSGRIPAATDWIAEWRANNYGLRVRPSRYHVDDEYSYKGYYDFATRHVADTTRWPVLRVTYEGRRLVPQISTSSGSIETTVVRGDAVPEESLTVWNSGEGTLNYTATTEAPWIQLSGDTEASSDGETHQVNVTFDPSLLPLGYHEGEIIISDPEAGNSPVSVPVTFGVLGPGIAHDPSAVTATVEAGNSPEATSISIWNSGHGQLDFAVAKTAAWLTLSATEGQSTGDAEQITLGFDAAALEAGVYEDTVTISDQNGDAAAKQIPVELTVLGRVVAPVLSPADGTVGQREIAVEMSCTTSGAEVRYTTDGSLPTVESPLYPGTAVVFTNTTLVRAAAWHAEMLPSDDVSGLYHVNHDPVGLALSQSTVGENRPAGTTVGTLSASDPDSTDTFTYALAVGDGDTDNGRFSVNGDQLVTAEQLDYETQTACTIRLSTTDQHGLAYEQSFTVTVVNNQAAPLVQLDPDDTGSDYFVAHRIDSGAVALAGGPGPSITDSDSTSLWSATVSILNHLDGQDEWLAVTLPTRALTPEYDGNTGTLVLTGFASLDEYEAALAAVTYENGSTTPDTTPREIGFVVNDGEEDSPVATCHIFLTDDTVEYTLETGWNLISAPFDTAPWTPFPELLCDADGDSLVAGQVWAWDTEGREYKALVNGATAEQACWAYCVSGAQDRTVTTALIDGRLRDGILSLWHGWNMVGPVVDVPADTILGLSEAMGPVWYWDEVLGAYRAVPADALLQKGRGYWVYVTDDVEVDMLPQTPRR